MIFVTDFEKIMVLLRKGVLCYRYIDSWEKFNEKPLLTKENFFSRLNNKEMLDRNYRYAQGVKIKFNIEDLRLYVISMYNMADTV